MPTRQSQSKLSRQPVARPTPSVWPILSEIWDLQLAGQSSDAALKRVMAKGPRLKPALLHAAIHELDAMNRHRARLSWALTEEGVAADAHTLVLAWAAMGRRQTPEHLRREIPLERDDASLLARLGKRPINDKRAPESVRLECPPAFERPLRAALGDRFAAELRASLEPAQVDLRVNALKAGVADCARLLNKERVVAEQMTLSPWGLRCAHGANIGATRVFDNGIAEFQDEGSQLVALLVDARPEHQVLDYCAGAGGKTLALGAAMKNKGHLVAADINDDRLARAKQRLKRAGVENAERRIIDKDWAKKHKGRFDRVLVDAPCSGTGSWRRNPDARWSPSAAKLDELAALQDRILDSAARFVKPGGRLVYATCSLLPIENDERIEAFLHTHREFALTAARSLWATLSGAPWPSGNENVLRLSPAVHGTDGFFAAVLTRAPEP